MGLLIRFLILFVIVVAILSVLRGLMAGSDVSRQERGSANHGPTRSGRLVKDPVCGTYIPESSAIRLNRGETLFFCSEECRNRYRDS